MSDGLPDRPPCAPKAPPKDALREVYIELLAVERERLAVGVRIEKERGFVYPEVSVICRDIRYLAERIYGRGSSEVEASVEASVEGECGPPAQGEPSEAERALDEALDGDEVAL